MVNFKGPYLQNTEPIQTLKTSFDSMNVGVAMDEIWEKNINVIKETKQPQNYMANFLNFSKKTRRKSKKIVFFKDAYLYEYLIFLNAVCFK